MCVFDTRMYIICVVSYILVWGAEYPCECQSMSVGAQAMVRDTVQPALYSGRLKGCYLLRCYICVRLG